MGNFSRDTFDPSKNYVGVRLQQGVPLVDADWNELNDVIRQEQYDIWNTLLPTAVIRGLNVVSYDIDNGNLSLEPGQAVIAGRCVKNVDPIINESILTTPSTDRTDLAYLAVWDREVTSTEDPKLINPAIGIETCVRLKRELELRVAEGTTKLPLATQGYFFLPLALLWRKAGRKGVSFNSDIRPSFRGLRMSGTASFLPAFLPTYYVEPITPWKISFGYGQRPKFTAFKEAGVTSGVLPLVLPDGAHLDSLKIRGRSRELIKITLLRIRHSTFDTEDTPENEMYDKLVEETIPPDSQFNRDFDLKAINRDYPGKLVVSNSLFYYGLLVEALDPQRRGSSIDGISIDYKFE